MKRIKIKETPKDGFEEMEGMYGERKETFSIQQERQLVHVVIIYTCKY